jgi:hypothetical protein
MSGTQFMPSGKDLMTFLDPSHSNLSFPTRFHGNSALMWPVTYGLLPLP